MNARRLVLQLILFTALAISGCGSPRPSPTSRPAGSSIGTIERVSDTVNRNQNQVTGTNQLFQNDSLRLFNGGEGLLDFGSDMVLRMFNDTQLGGVRTSNAPGTPLIVKITLFAGGFTGQVFRGGSRASFDTPNGAQINVFGTDFFIVYDPDQDLVTAGNFGGDMEIQAGGSGPVPIPSGTLRQAQGGDPPSPEAPIPFSMTDFEEMSRQFQSPVAVVNEAVAIEPEPEPGDTEPPDIVVNRIEPERLLIGSECPDSPNTVEVTYLVLDESGVADTAVDWEVGEQRGTASIERIDDETFLAFVGPVETTGTLRITLNAVDNAGNFASSSPMNLEVEKCIG